MAAETTTQETGAGEAQKKSPIFNAAAVRDNSYFGAMLDRYFNRETSKAVLKVLESMQVPLPTGGNDFLSSQAGALIFSNKLGVVIRIEQGDGISYNNASRVDNSAWMLRPLGAKKIGQAHIEVLPGIHLEKDDVESRKLYWRLWRDGYSYWDERIDNAGRLPFKSPKFPNGVTVSVDRLSANKLLIGIAPIMRALNLAFGTYNPFNYRSPLEAPKATGMNILAEFREMGRELTQKMIGRRPFKPGVDDPQEILYGELNRAFQDAWPDGQDFPDAAKMKVFWEKVQQAKDEGKLVAGWNEVDPQKNVYKTSSAVSHAEHYEKVGAVIGDIEAATSLRDHVFRTLEEFSAYGTQYKSTGGPRDISWSFISVRPTDIAQISTEPPGGGAPEVFTIPFGKTGETDTFAFQHNLKGISETYRTPYGLTEPFLAAYAETLRHQEMRGMITREERGEAMSVILGAIETLNPQLGEIPFDRGDADKAYMVVMGVAQKQNRNDIRFQVSDDQPPGDYEALLAEAKGHSADVSWRVSPQTLQDINRQLGERKATQEKYEAMRGQGTSNGKKPDASM